MSKNARREQMLELVHQWQQSDLSQKAFAELHQINVHTFRYWIHKARKTSSTTERFIELPIPEVSAQICVRYPNGVELYLPASTPADTLQTVIHFR